MKRMPLWICLVGIPLVLTCPRVAAAFPQGYRLMEGSESPDGKIGILEPSGVPEEKFWSTHNFVVEIRTGKIIGTLEGVPGLQHMNNGGAEARWSPDGQLLLWAVDGKWGPRTATFAGFQKSQILRQVDLIKQGDEEILQRAKATFPKSYAAAVAQNRGNGSAYPEGFTVAVNLRSNEAVLPAEFIVTLTSNPKGMEDFPKQAELDGFLFGTLDADFQIHWGKSGIFDSSALKTLASQEERARKGLAHQLDATLNPLSAKQREKLAAGQREWEKDLSAIDDAWPITSSVSASLPMSMRLDAYRERVKTLSEISNK